MLNYAYSEIYCTRDYYVWIILFSNRRQKSIYIIINYARLTINQVAKGRNKFAWKQKPAFLAWKF